MTSIESRAGRARDAKRARETILDAAEVVFAQHGFVGARSEAIARASGYNISLLFQYFGDKLGLYTEVLKRIDREITALQTRFAPVLEDDTGTLQEQGFRVFLATVVQTMFDYLIEHPRFLRMLTWEMAEGWQTYRQIVSQLQSEDADQFKRLFQQVERAGLLRSSFTPLIQLAMITPICQSFLAYLPLYQVMLPAEDVSSQQALSHAREHLVAFIVAGMMVAPPEPNSEQPKKAESES